VRFAGGRATLVVQYATMLVKRFIPIDATGRKAAKSLYTSIASQMGSSKQNATD
jgi:hypothetical protein